VVADAEDGGASAIVEGDTPTLRQQIYAVIADVVAGIPVAGPGLPRPMMRRGRRPLLLWSFIDSITTEASPSATGAVRLRDGYGQILPLVERLLHHNGCAVEYVLANGATSPGSRQETVGHYYTHHSVGTHQTSPFHQIAIGGGSRIR